MYMLCVYACLGAWDIYVCVLMQLIFILNKITTNVFFEVPCTSEPMHAHSTK